MRYVFMFHLSRMLIHTLHLCCPLALGLCSGAIAQSSNKVTFDELWGLWVILGVGAAIGFIFVGLAKFRRYRRYSIKNPGEVAGGDFKPLPAWRRYPRLVKSESVRTDASGPTSRKLTPSSSGMTLPRISSRFEDGFHANGVQPTENPGAPEGEAGEKISDLQKQSSMFGEIFEELDEPEDGGEEYGSGI